MMRMTVAHDDHDDADDVDADDDDEDDGDDDDVLFSLASCAAPAAAKAWRGRSGPPGQQGHKRPGVSPHLGLCGRGLAVTFPRHEDRLSEVQGVQEVAGTQVAPIVEELCQRDVLGTTSHVSRQRQGHAQRHA